MKKMVSCAVVAIAACLFTALPAQAVTTFILGDQPGEVTGDSMQVRVTISELAGSLGLKNSLNVKLDVVSPYVGDLLGAFFHVSDETLLSSLVVTGANVTEVKIDANNVLKVGGGNVMNGAVSSGFDVGVRIGTSGIGIVMTMRPPPSTSEATPTISPKPFSPRSSLVSASKASDWIAKAAANWLAPCPIRMMTSSSMARQCPNPPPQQWA